MVAIAVQPHPLLEVGAFVVRLAHPLGEASKRDAIETPPPGLAIETPHRCAVLRAPTEPGLAIADAPMATSEAVKLAVRDLLRHGGFKPAGRSKPASEYLAGAAAEGRFPRINALVDACNIVSLHSGLPISLVDADKLDGALAIQIAPAGTTYPFNPTGQVIDASGLVCLYDAQGPTGTPVKDAQRTKTDDATRSALAIVWGTRALAGRTAQATRWFRELCAAIPNATLEDVTTA